ncbi:MAG: hypothetical protein WCF24_05865 [Acidimicrobiales bacterium]
MKQRRTEAGRGAYRERVVTVHTPTSPRSRRERLFSVDERHRGHDRPDQLSECETLLVARTVRIIKRVEFNVEDPDEILGYMSLLSDARDGWINLMPEKANEKKGASLGFMSLFGGGSPGTTMCTWIPEREDQNGRRHVSLGITHTTGRRISAQISTLDIPASWRIKQDHAQRGLVLSVPDDEPHDRVLAWAFRAIRALSPASRAGTWRAEIYLPTGHDARREGPPLPLR